MDHVDKQIEEEDIKNRYYRKRIMLLIPFNGLMMYLTIRYSKNIHKIGAKYWPQYQKATLKNLLIVGTV